MTEREKRFIAVKRFMVGHSRWPLYGADPLKAKSSSTFQSKTFPSALPRTPRRRRVDFYLFFIGGFAYKFLRP
jgi:hypothetical protein